MCILDLMTLDGICSGYGCPIAKKKNRFFAMFALHMAVLASNNPTKFLTGFSAWKHIQQRIDEHESSQKHQACVEAYLRFSSSKMILDLLAVSQTSLRKQ